MFTCISNTCYTQSDFFFSLANNIFYTTSKIGAEGSILRYGNVKLSDLHTLGVLISLTKVGMYRTFKSDQSMLLDFPINTWSILLQRNFRINSRGQKPYSC